MFVFDIQLTTNKTKTAVNGSSADPAAAMAAALELFSAACGAPRAQGLELAPSAAAMAALAAAAAVNSISGVGVGAHPLNLSVKTERDAGSGVLASQQQPGPSPASAGLVPGQSKRAGQGGGKEAEVRDETVQCRWCDEILERWCDFRSVLAT